MRHAWTAGTVTGTTTFVTIASAIAFDGRTWESATDDGVRLDGLAQQPSACSGLMATTASSEPCIAQLVRFVQHAIRAGGVACHPAQTARLPTQIATTIATAPIRLANPIISVGCVTVVVLSI